MTFASPRQSLRFLSSSRSVIQTISTTTLKGCKDHANDASVGTQNGGTKEQYIGALGSFCNSKRAETAFAWFLMRESCDSLFLSTIR